jgi:hypothetical protein
MSWQHVQIDLFPNCLYNAKKEKTPFGNIRYSEAMPFLISKLERAMASIWTMKISHDHLFGFEQYDVLDLFAASMHDHQ